MKQFTKKQKPPEEVRIRTLTVNGLDFSIGEGLRKRTPLFLLFEDQSLQIIRQGTSM